MLYTLMSSEQDIQKLTLILEAAKDMKFVKPREAQRMINYIADEVEVQDRELKLAKEGKDLFASMKIDVNLIEEQASK